MTLQVIGAGFGRTGTLSLKAGLETLGFGPCYHMVETLEKPDAARLLLQALDGAPNWEALFAGYAATVDWPACHFWRELAAYYPNAKILLSVRDAEKWFASTQATILSEAAVSSINANPDSQFYQMVRRIIHADVGGKPHDRGSCIAAFERHNAAVIAETDPKRLLVYEVTQGWAPLCEFLNVPIPATPFPQTNSTEEFMNKVRPAVSARP